ncbi:MAG TPA: hypothetical protein VF062_16495 [Candidatus Limnocylindrales bacterium]
MNATVVTVRLPVPIVDLAPVASEHGSVWLLLAEDGWIGRFHADRGTWEVQARCTVPDEPSHDPWMGHRLRRRLLASADGRYAVVVNDFGRHGQLLDLATGSVSMTLDGGGYQSETVPFSAAFVEHDGRMILIHRTA